MSDNGGHPLEDGQETMDQLAIAMLAPVVNLGVAPYPRLNPGSSPSPVGSTPFMLALGHWAEETQSGL